MRKQSAAYLALVVLLLQTMPVLAQTQDLKRTRINGMRVGFLPGPTTPYGEYKAGAWTPVYVEVQCGPEPVGRTMLVVEAVDTDDVRGKYRVEMEPMQPGEQRLVMTYAKPGSQNGEISATLLSERGTLANFQENYSAMDLDQQLFLVVGKQTPSLRRMLIQRAKKDIQEDNLDIRDTGACRVTGMYGREGVAMMPRKWFAYEPVDLVILTTGDRDFLNELEADSIRKEALAEWVRRGGHLLVSVASNQDMVAKLSVLDQVLPVTIEGQSSVPRLLGVERWATTANAPLTQKTGVAVAKIAPKPGRECDRVLQENDNTPIILRGAYGLGEVTVVAMDLDEAPFKTWSANDKFWQRLLKEAGVPEPKDPSGQQTPQWQRNPTEENRDLATMLQTNLEDFPDVPVISFGWVALFILVYILIVGPLDYIFLKKVVKRLELTWITFPTVVITISVAAYFTAYWLKGNDQKINKVDFVDIDLHTKQAYGNTWFTIFSPRIQNYIVGLEPMMPGKVGTAPVAGAQPDSSVVLSWLGRPERGWGGNNRARSQGLFRRAYDYARDASGMERVPIQVWSTKSFTASWQTPLDPAKPMIQAELTHPIGRPELLSGTITNNLAVPLEDVAVYFGRGATAAWYSLGRLAPSSPKRVDNLMVGGSGMKMDSWIQQIPEGAASVRRPQTTNMNSQRNLSGTSIVVLKQLMFFEGNPSKRADQRNSALHNLDLSWRLNRKQEVIMFARLPRSDGIAEDVITGDATLSRLWLGSLPGAGAPREPVLGGMAQETYLRVLIPVRDAEAQ